MKKILATIGEKIKMGIETAIGACMNQLIKLGEWLKRVRNDILNKLLVKISSLSQEGYSQQLIRIEERIKELRDLLASEKGKDAREIFEFISKSPKEDLDKIAILAETVRSIQEKDAREIFDFISKSPKEDLEKIMTLAETTKEFKKRDTKAFSKFIKKFSKEELEKTAILAKTEKAIQKGDAKAIFGFLSTTPKEKLEKMAILAGAARAVQELDEIEIPPDGVVKFDKYIKAQEIYNRFEALKELVKKGEVPEENDVKGVIKEVEKKGLFSGIAKIALDTRRLDTDTGRLDTELGSMGRRGKTLQPAQIEKIERIRIHGEEGREHEGEEREISEEIGISYQKGVECLREERNEEAYNRFDEIIKNNPNLKGAWLNKGIAARRLGRRGEAIYCYSEALRIDRGYEKASHNLQIIS